MVGMGSVSAPIENALGDSVPFSCSIFAHKLLGLPGPCVHHLISRMWRYFRAGTERAACIILRFVGRPLNTPFARSIRLLVGVLAAVGRRSISGSSSSMK